MPLRDTKTLNTPVPVVFSSSVLVWVAVVLVRTETSRHDVSRVAGISRLSQLRLARVRTGISRARRRWRASRVVSNWCVAAPGHFARISRRRCSGPWRRGIAWICLGSRRNGLGGTGRRWRGVASGHGVLLLLRRLLLRRHARTTRAVHWRPPLVPHAHVVRLLRSRRWLRLPAGPWRCRF
jgi:hypothetical protein